MRFLSSGRSIVLLPLLFLAGLRADAQELLLNNNPMSVRWSQVNTPYFRVVFPRGFDAQAIRVANTLEYIREKESRTLGSKPRLITLLLQNQNAESNGFVSVLPRRSEFYITPPQDYNALGTNDWLSLLASHEFRHIAQYQHATQKFNKLFYYLFGANTMAGFAHLAVPQWFWEGDAVATETAFTPAGRGKIPSFSLAFKSNLLEGRTFNYHKQYLRSYKHHIPDHYVLGYHMVNYLRGKTDDPEIWGKISGRAWSYPFLPFVFSRSIKRKAGVNVSGLYKEMAADFRSKWQKQIDTTRLTSFTTVPLSRTGYTDFSFPQQLGDGRLFTTKSGIGDFIHFALADRKQSEIFTPGFVTDAGMLSAAGNTIVWTEYGYDPRWPMRTYSLIKAYDVKKKKKKVVGGRKTKYTNAAISPDETKIVASQTDTNYKTQLVILSYPEGKVLKVLDNPSNDFYSMARWSDKGDKIVSLKTSTEGRAVVLIDPTTSAEEILIPASQENIGYPVLYKDYLFYNSPVTGIDNIFALDLKTKKRYQVTSSKYGAYNPLISNDGKVIYYNNQSRDGLDVVQIPYQPDHWQPFGTRHQENSLYRHLVEQEASENAIDHAPQRDLQVTKFSKAAGIFNPYTWGFFIDNTFTRGNFGFTSQDLLSTTAIEAGYQFDVFERTSALRAMVSYQGLYPIIDVTGTMADRVSTETTSTDVFEFRWREQTLEAGLRVPLVLTRSKYRTEVNVGSAAGLIHVEDFRNTLDFGTSRVVGSNLYGEYVGNGNLVYTKSSFRASHLLKRSRRDINSKYGQAVEVLYYNTIEPGDYFGGLFSTTASAFFPGLMKHHSLWGYAAFQWRKIRASEQNYVFRNEIPLPRGFGMGTYSHFYSFSANYTMPVWYPDIAIGPLLNLQRLRTNFFFDYGYGELPRLAPDRAFNSVGIEARLDMNLFRLMPQFDLGVRYSVGIDPKVNRFEILIGSFNL